MTEGTRTTGTQNTKTDLRITAKYDWIHVFLLSLGSNFARLVASLHLQCTKTEEKRPRSFWETKQCGFHPLDRN